MAHHLPTIACHALLLASASALAQNNTVLITSPASQQVSGFENLSLREAPFSATNIDNATLRDLGAQRISDALRLDSSVTDSYNSPAYWDMLSVRGFMLDNRYNYRREGLPINAETMIAMDNKERIELFKGTSGIQAGTSAPGGIANYVVKRPPNSIESSVRSLTLSYGNGNNSSVALDVGGRYGENNAFFYVTLDPERALGLEDILPNYTIICPYKSHLTESLHYQYTLKRVLVLEEHLTPKEVDKIVERGTYGILQSDFVQKHINANVGYRKPHIMVLKNSQLIEDFCKKQKWKLFAPKAKIAEKFENKISQYKLLKNIVPYPPSFICSIQELRGIIENSPNSPLSVLQFNRGHSGNSTFFLKSKKDLETLYTLYPKRECKISEYIKGKTYTLNCLVLKNGGVITGSISEQITGLKSATNNANTTCGNDFTSPRKLSRKQVGGIQEIAQNVGRTLHKKSYRGLFGIDVIIEKATGNVYFLEVNTHQPASISFEAKLHRRIGKAPLLAYFILDSIRPVSSPYEGEVRRGRPPIILPISARQVIYRNKTSKILRSRDIVKKYRRKGLVSRMKFIKPNEEIYRIQHGV